MPLCVFDARSERSYTATRMMMDDPRIKQTLAATYASLAQEYERAIVPIYRPMAKRLLQLIDLRPGWQVLDAGTGTGLVALLGAPRVGKSGKMIGIDASEKMLEIAREKAGKFGFTQCEFCVGDLETLDFPEAQFNACLSQFALHYTDVAKSLRELHRVLMPGGTLVIQVWAADSSAPHRLMYEMLERHCAVEASGTLAILRAQSERSYRFRQMFGKPEAMKSAVESAGFSKVDAREERHPAHVLNVDAFLDVANVSPLLHAEIAALSDEAHEGFSREARESLRTFETASGFEWTFNVIAVVAQK